MAQSPHPTTESRSQGHSGPGIAPDGSLPESFRRLDKAVGALIDARDEYINGRTAAIPSLYIQLYDAVPGEQGNGHAPARSMPPLWIDASHLLGQIDAAIRKWQPAYTKPAQRIAHLLPPTMSRLRELLQRSWRPQDTHLMDDMSAQLEGWVIDIDMLLTPQHVKSVSEPCPSCGHKTAYRKDSAGETVRVSALQLNPAEGCMCIVCKAFWPPAHFGLLAKVLGCPTPEGVIEA